MSSLSTYQVTETDSLAEVDRRNSLNSLYYLCKEVLQYRDLSPRIHYPLSIFATHPKYGRFRQATLPRSWFKTWFWTVGKSIWLTLHNPKIRILIASNIVDNASKMLHKIKHEWETNERLRAAFPELVPDLRKVRWSDKCAEIGNGTGMQEGNYTAIGVGGSAISQHFDHIIEDDLIYAKKDDFSGAELMPDQEDIDKAIGWHKIATSLLSDPNTGCIDNIGTRWAPHDLVDYIRTHESHYAVFEVRAEDEEGNPLWPERFPREVLDNIKASQGTYIYSTQYLNNPRDLEDVTFEKSWLKFYTSNSEIPRDATYYTIVDLAGWGDSKGVAKNVVCTVAIDMKHRLWVVHYDRGRFNPSVVIQTFKLHQKIYSSRVYIEEVQYQRAVRHFAKLEMERTGNRYRLHPLPFDGRKDAKHLRILNIQNWAQSGGLYIKPTMHELLNEYEDYPYSKTVDILDCIGWAIRIAKPEKVLQERKVELSDFSVERIEQELYERYRSNECCIPSPLANPLERIS